MRVIDDALRDTAFDLATRVFVAGSTVHRALGIGLEEYRAYLAPSFDAMIAQGLSLAAFDADVEVDGGKMVGCVIVTDFHAQPGEGTKVPPKFAPLTALTDALCAQYDAQRSPDRGKAILVDMGAVLPEHAGQGVYQTLRNAAQDHAKSHGYSKAIGELSSAATQHTVLNRLGHKKIAEIRFDTFEIAGAFPFQSITTPKSIVLTEGNL